MSAEMSAEMSECAKALISFTAPVRFVPAGVEYVAGHIIDPDSLSAIQGRYLPEVVDVSTESQP